MTSTPEDVEFDPLVMQLMRETIHRVADEETILLPEAERSLAGELEALGWRMTQRRFQLAGPRAGEIAINTARSFPGAVLTGTALLAVGAYMAGRAFSRRTYPSGRKWLGLAR